MLLNQCFDFSQYDKLDIALISDTHADLSPDILELVNKSDLVIHAGDICSMDVLHELQPRLKHVIAVAGNNDKPYVWDVKDWSVVRSLPEAVDVKLASGVISVEHGHRHDMFKPSHDSLRQAHPNARVVVYGHTHHQIIDDSNDIWVINPGAAGKTRTHGGPSCVVLSISEDGWHHQTYRFSQF